jgi:carboxypeptidase Q
MKIKKISLFLFLLSYIPFMVMSQTENVDLTMIYKIKQEGMKNSSIEDLAFGLTDFTGPRLTCSDGNRRGTEKWKSLAFRMYESRQRAGWQAVAGIT